MTSWLWRLRVLGALAVLAGMQTTLAVAQPPMFITAWGSYGSGPGQFNGPSGVAVDGSGNVYVADLGNSRIQKFTSSGIYLTQWGSSGSGNGQFQNPWDVATDVTGNVYVVDAYNYRIQKFTGTGTYLTQWGSSGSGPGQFRFPDDVAVDGGGNVYVSDLLDNRIQKFTSGGTYMTQWTTNDVGCTNPRGLEVDNSGNVYVACENEYVTVFTNTGVYVDRWSTNITYESPMKYVSPYDVALDGNGHVYLVDNYFSRIFEYTMSGTMLYNGPISGSLGGYFQRPNAVAADAAGNVYVADTGHNQIQAFGTPATPAQRVSWGRLKSRYH